MTHRLPADPSADPPAINMPNLTDQQLICEYAQVSDQIQETEAYLIEQDAYNQYEASDQEENEVVEKCFSAPWQDTRRATYIYWSSSCQKRLTKEYKALRSS